MSSLETLSFSSFGEPGLRNPGGVGSECPDTGRITSRQVESEHRGSSRHGLRFGFGFGFGKVLRLGLGAASLFSVATSEPSTAATFGWEAPVDGNWHTAANWNPDGIPTSGDLVTFLPDGTYTVTIDQLDAEADGFNLFRPGVTLAVENARTLTIHDDTPFVIGRIHVGDSEPSDLPATLRFEETATVGGGGTIRLNSGLEEGRSRSFLECGGVLTLGSAVTVEGNGTISAVFVNEGLIHAGNLLMTGNSSVNNGVIRAGAGGAIEIDATLFSQGPDGLIEASLNSEIVVHKCVGGTLAGNDGGVIRPLQELSDCTLIGRVEFPSAPTGTVNPALTWGGEIENEGQMIVFGVAGNPASQLRSRGFSSPEDTFVSGQGWIELQSGEGSESGARLGTSHADSRFIFGSGQVITGRGTFFGKVQIDGVLSPGVTDGIYTPDDPTATFELDDLSYTTEVELTSSAQLVVELGGTESGSFDQVLGDGNASETKLVCAGTLVLSHIDGFAGLDTGEELSIISQVGVVEGTFAAVVQPEGFEYEIVYEEHEVRIRPAAPSGVEDGDPSAPGSEILASHSSSVLTSFPNPLPAIGGTLRFQLQNAGPARIEVVDVQGRVLAVPAEGSFGAGLHEVEWDGRNRDGVTLRSGVYFQRLITASGSSNRKVILLP